MATEAEPRDEPGHMTLIEHLVELRTRLIRCTLAVGVAAIGAWFLYQPIFDLLLEPLAHTAPDDELARRLLATDPLAGFRVRIQITTYTAIALALPMILWQLWRFVSPGLYANEKRYGVAFMLTGTVLFVCGAAIAFWTLPKALEFLQAVGGEDNFTEFYTPDKYLRLIVYMMLAFGIGFEFPLVVVTLQFVGLVDTATLRNIRRYVIIIVAIFVAVATPSGDPISMLALTIPMCLLYEAAILIGRLRERRRRKAEEAEVQARGGS